MQSQDSGRTLPTTRRGGVCLHITSLAGRHGIGTIGNDARSFVDTLGRMRLGVWQFLPLGPTGYGDSPYQSLSTFAGNELLIDLDDLVHRALLTDGEIAPLTELATDHVDYGRLIPLKSQLLAVAASRLVASERDGAGLQQFIERNDTKWLHDYCLYRVLKEHYEGRPWTEWSAEHADRTPAALRDVEAKASERIAAFKALQFLFHEQWQRLKDYAHDAGVSLFGDVPIYIAADSADAWTHRDLLQVDDRGHPSRVSGVPPDFFSADGQLWGNPLYEWDTHKEQGFAWWIDRVRAASECADILRLDHFRGFESYWSVAADAETARDGHWESAPGDDLFNALHSALGSLPFVAEDLGVITHEVDALRERHGLPGMTVLQFAMHSAEFQLTDVEENRVCYTGTHDTDTTLGWFRGGPDDTRSEYDIEVMKSRVLELTGGSPETVSLDIVRAAFSTAARLAIAPLQDILSLDSASRMNIPGTPSGNWQWRVKLSEMDDGVCEQIASIVSATGRDG